MSAYTRPPGNPASGATPDTGALTPEQLAERLQLDVQWRNPMTQDALTVLSEKATPGPWQRWTETAADGYFVGFSFGPKEGGVGGTYKRTGNDLLDADFIVALVNAYRAGHLTQASEAEGLRAAAQAVIDGWDDRGIEVVALPSLEAMDALRAALATIRLYREGQITERQACDWFGVDRLTFRSAIEAEAAIPAAEPSDECAICGSRRDDGVHETAEECEATHGPCLNPGRHHPFRAATPAATPVAEPGLDVERLALAMVYEAGYLPLIVTGVAERIAKRYAALATGRAKP